MDKLFYLLVVLNEDIIISYSVEVSFFYSIDRYNQTSLAHKEKKKLYRINTETMEIEILAEEEYE